MMSKDNSWGTEISKAVALQAVMHRCLIPFSLASSLVPVSNHPLLQAILVYLLALQLIFFHMHLKIFFYLGSTSQWTS